MKLMEIKISKFLNNRNGFSMLEVIISTAILCGVAAVAYTGLSSVSHQVTKQKVNTASDDIYTAVLNNFRTSAAQLQVDYSSTSEMSALSVLPLAWDRSGEMISVKDCLANCPQGRMGINTKPIVGSKGLYIQTIRLTHPTWQDPKMFSTIIGE